MGMVDVVEQEWEADTPIQGRHISPAWNMFNAGSKELPDERKRELLKRCGVEAGLDEVLKVEEALAHQVSCGASGAGAGSGFISGRSEFEYGASTHLASVGKGWMFNHSVRGYHILLEKGFGGLRAEIQAELERFPFGSVEQVEREPFLCAVRELCDAGLLLGRKLAALAEANGRGDVAENCRAVESGAFSLASAVQLLWLGHIIAVADDGLNANSIGRLDQLLWPYYLMDEAAGRKDDAAAHELMVDLAIKLYQSYDVQAITLGGSDREGKCACNTMTEIILDATADFGRLRDLSLRVTEDMPDSVMERAAKLVLKGGGIPYFLNDRCFVKALADRGIDIGDARNYAPIGCIELTIPGKANSRAVSGWFNLLKVLELTINGGRDMMRGEQQLPPGKTLPEYMSYDEFEAAFLENMRQCAMRMVYNCRAGEKSQRQHGSLPSFSMLTEPCLQRGRDVTDHGAEYNWHSVCLMAVPDVADSLVALRKLVFEEKKIDAAELFEALRNDFEGNEVMRQILISGAPKYGNGIEEVDCKAAEMSRAFIEYMDSIGEEDSRFFVHLFSFYVNVECGKETAATPNGRRRGTPFAYSLSAHPGMDASGVSAMLHSLARQPHDMAAGGSAAIIDLHPSLVKTEDPVRTFLALQKSAVDMGVGQVQWNIVSAEDMLRARNEPERYGNLHVRVAGYSQMFKLIPPDLQMHLIERTKHQQ
jgi:formate C-acetyltransferase